MLEKDIQNAIEDLYQKSIKNKNFQLQKTKTNFNGDITIVIYPLLSISKKNPEQTCKEIGNHLLQKLPYIDAYKVIKGFLNITVKNSFWLNCLQKTMDKINYGYQEMSNKKETIMLEFSSPNTNKPLHLGHIRNNLLGDSLSRILKANGYKVIKTNIINDRGIHICKSMYAWLKLGKGITPKLAKQKGDHLVGEYYVKFNNQFKNEVKELTAKGKNIEEAENLSPSMIAVRHMLKQWENNDKAIRELWIKMNKWVYEGFNTTYRKLGISFDKVYYESDTYILGKEEVIKGLNDGVFYKKEDGSVWADLTRDGLDHKILLRSDGTSVYMTQDIGTAKIRFADCHFDKMIYVVGNEQIYHFSVLAILLDKLGYKWGKDLVHYSYGMVGLTEGKMKSREGNVVDADYLIEEMELAADNISKEVGKLNEELKKKARKKTIENIALGALKYFILKVDPKKNMTFNPKSSIDFNGNTGAFIQYTHARICSVLKKSKNRESFYTTSIAGDTTLEEKEKDLVQKILDFPNIVKHAGRSLSPALIANFCYDLAKAYNQFYHDHSILSAGENDIVNFRLILSRQVKLVLKNGMALLGIKLPKKM